MCCFHNFLDYFLFHAIYTQVLACLIRWIQDVIHEDVYLQDKKWKVEEFCRMYHFKRVWDTCIFGIVIFHNTMSCLRDEPAARRLSVVVVQTLSSLLNAATMPLEVKDVSTVTELRQLLLSRKILPMDDYLFIHKQRIMRDNYSLRWHGVGGGDFLYVFTGTVYRSG